MAGWVSSQNWCQQFPYRIQTKFKFKSSSTQYTAGKAVLQNDLLSLLNLALAGGDFALPKRKFFCTAFKPVCNRRHCHLCLRCISGFVSSSCTISLSPPCHLACPFLPSPQSSWSAHLLHLHLHPVSGTMSHRLLPCESCLVSGHMAFDSSISSKP